MLLLETRSMRFERTIGRGLLRVLFVALSLQASMLVADPSAKNADLVGQLVEAAIERTQHQVTYDGSYRRIDYPRGDVPNHVGVCTDLVVRSYRAVGVDLQQRVHEDMSRAFSEYPPIWGLSKPDPNIDHRRVPNLQRFLHRQGASLPVTNDPRAYLAGDLVTWNLPGNLPHIGFVVDQRSKDGTRPLIVHNIGSGPKLEDMLFSFPISGHYRYLVY